MCWVSTDWVLTRRAQRRREGKRGEIFERCNEIVCPEEAKPYPVIPAKAGIHLVLE